MYEESNICVKMSCITDVVLLIYETRPLALNRLNSDGIMLPKPYSARMTGLKR